jgi:hypothetical protein
MTHEQDLARPYRFYYEEYLDSNRSIVCASCSLREEVRFTLDLIDSYDAAYAAEHVPDPTALTDYDAASMAAESTLPTERNINAVCQEEEFVAPGTITTPGQKKLPRPSDS